MGAFDIEKVEEAGHVVVISKGARREVSAAEATQVTANDPVVTGKGAGLLRPHTAVGDTGVQQQQGCARSFDFVIQFCAVDGGHPPASAPGLSHGHLP